MPDSVQADETIRRLHLPMQTRLAPITLAAEGNETGAKRSVKVVWSTGARVRRQGWEGPYYEELAMEPAAVDLSRLNGGAPLLDSHNAYALAGIIGVVERAWLADGEGRAVVRFSDRAEIEPIWRDVQAGIIRNVSVGYEVRRFEKLDAAAGGIPVLRATSWAPLEISLVPIGADARAGTRAAPEPLFPCTVLSGPSREESDMSFDERAGAAALDEQDPHSRPVTADVAAERQRIAEIQQLARSVGADPAAVDELVASGASVEAARKRLWDDVVARSSRNEIAARPSGAVVTDWTDPAATPQRMSDALYARMTGTAPAPAAREFAALRLTDMLRHLAAARGERVRHLSDGDLLARGGFGQTTTSDLPLLLAGTGNRVLLAGYAAASSAFKLVSRQSLAPDFRPLSTIRFGEPPTLREVPEHCEITHGSTDETGESYALKTFARIFALSRRALINDDLQAFSDWARWIGRAAAEAEASAFIALLALNGGTGPTMSDGKALFHADHGNLAGSGAAIGVTTLSAARQAIRLQKALDGATPIGGTPRYLLVGPATETVAEQVLATLYPAQPSSANPFSGRLELVVEPRLAGNSWFVFCDPAQLPVLQHSYLEAAQGPQLATEQDFDTLGLKFRCVLDFGVGVVDHRGVYRNPG